MKKWMIILCVCSRVAMATAALRTADEAAALAMQWLNEPMLERVDLQLVHHRRLPDNLTPVYYIFNRSNQRGYIIVSADDRAVAILGYTDHGSFDVTQVNPSMQWLLNLYARQISQLTDDNLSDIDERTTEVIFPLLGATMWDQTVPYYNMCPKDMLTGDLSMTGCVATATAMIMNMWRHPIHGVGRHTYTWCQQEENARNEVCAELSLQFDTIAFDWDNMRSSYKRSYSDVEASAVAQLMYCCGVACNMSYSSAGSGSFTDDMGWGLITYFGYTYSQFVSATSRAVYSMAKGKRGIALKNTKFSCTTSELEAFLNADLEAGRPVLMGGRDEQSGGHEFVCDGRDASGKYHINWGWEGYDNGYFTLTALGKSYNFSEDIDMLIGLEPAVPSAIKMLSAEDVVAAQKWLDFDGKLYIVRGERRYDIMGNEVR